MRDAPPPFRKTIDGPVPAPKAAAAAVPSPPANESPPAIEPPAVIEPPPESLELALGWTPLGWIPPPWLRSGRVQIAIAVVGAIFLIGIMAAIAVDDDELRAEPGRATVASAAPTRADDKAADPPPREPSEPSPPSEDEPDVDNAAPKDDAPAKKRHRPAKRSSSKPPPTQKKPASTRQVRLMIKSDPAGASIKVNGDSVDRGTAMVAAGSTVKVTATMRGYKRATRSVQVGKGKSIVIKLERM